ncbi:MAG: nucleoside-triphosphatase [Clostridiaceae bacterium]|nr:nucleoside-triphosphatase [Eubacteriales bacterium]
MSEKKHILICGEIGAGKSTLISRLIAHSARPVYGFVTKRLEADGSGFHPIYIHPAGSDARRYGENNLVGTCDRKIHNVNLDAFNTLGVSYLKAAPNGLIVMDELGFMEAKAEAFVSAVFDALNGAVPVIAAVKARFDVPFLNDVRAHPNTRLYTVTKENRDELFERLLPAVRAWDETF